MVVSHHTFSLEEKEESKTSYENSGEMSSGSTSCLNLDDIAFGLLK